MKLLTTAKAIVTGVVIMTGAIALRAPPAQALTVHDPANLAQNVVQAARALEQIHNQVRALEQQTKMLKQNPLNLSPDLARSIGEARALFKAAEGLTFQVDQLSAELANLYPETAEAFELDAISARTKEWLAADRRAITAALQAQARAADTIEQSQSQIDRALQSSAEAEGQTGVGQAGNQLLGINAAQLAQIHALLVAQSRALTVEAMERVAREERALSIQRRAFPSAAAAAPRAARLAF